MLRLRDTQKTQKSWFPIFASVPEKRVKKAAEER